MKTGGEILVAREPMFVTVKGVSVAIQKGQTVREGHPIVVGREDAFEPLTVDFELEEKAGK